jgi:hypothetical protein
MKARLLWLIITACAFVAWVGWLGYLAATYHHPITLSRPQLLVSQIDVAAWIKDEQTPVKIEEVYYEAPEVKRDLKARDEIEIDNLKSCTGFGGEGLYLVPLSKVGNRYRITAIPHSPGYRGDRNGADEFPIYPKTPETVEQRRHIAKPEMGK